MQMFCFSPPINLIEEGKWLLAVRSFEATNLVFNITKEKNSFPVSTPGYWSSRGGAVIFYKLQKSIALRSGNDVKFYVEEVTKRRNQKNRWQRV